MKTMKTMKTMRKLLLTGLLLLLPALGFAADAGTQDAAATVEAVATTTTSTVGVLEAFDIGSISDLISEASGALKGGDWGTVIGLLIAVLLAGAKRFGISKMIPKGWSKWVAAGMALLSALALGLKAGAPVLDILKSGGAMALAAVGGYEMVLKPVGPWLLKKVGMGKILEKAE